MMGRKRIGLLLGCVGCFVGGGILFAAVGHPRGSGSPARVDWQQTTGPIGGVVNRMKTINGEVWASLYSGGIYKFVENRWQQIAIFHGMPENRSFDFVADPMEPNTVYAAQLIACLGKSTDGGKNWKGLCDAFLSQLRVDNYSSKAIAIDPKDHTKIYIAGKDHHEDASIVMSPDQGKTWTMVHPFAKPMPINSLIFFKDRLYIATENEGVYRSEDRGKTWKALSAGLDQMQTGQFVADSKGKNLYLFTGLLQYNVREGGKVYVLDEKAGRWKSLGGPDRVTSLLWSNGALFAGNVPGEIWKKDAKGWKFLNRGAELPATVTELAFTDKNTLFAGARGFGIYRSLNGGKRFSDVSAGLIASATREIAVDPAHGKRFYVLSWDRPGVYYSEDGGESYTVFGGTIFTTSLAVFPGDFSHFYTAGFDVSTGRDWFYAITTSGGKETIERRPKPGPEGGVIKAIAVDPHDASHVLVGIGAMVAESPDGFGVYATHDGGKTWKKLPLPDLAAYALLFDHQDPKVVYVAPFSDGVYKSLDGGEHFTKIADRRLKYTYRMAMSPSNPKILLAGSQLFFAQLSMEEQLSGKEGGVFKSTDGGTTWREITAGYRNYGPDAEGHFIVALYNFGHMPNYEQMLIDPADSKHMLIGHHGENVFMTNDDGKTWIKQSSGMIPGDMHNYAYCLGADATFRMVYACTCGRGLFSSSVHADGSVSWRPVGLASVLPRSSRDDGSLPTAPRNAAEARERILEGLYTDAH